MQEFFYFIERDMWNAGYGLLQHGDYFQSEPVLLFFIVFRYMYSSSGGYS